MISHRLACAALLLALSGCGQKGSLYFAEPATAPAAGPAATQADDSDKDNPAPQDP